MSSLKPIIICFCAALFYCFDYMVQVTPSVISNQLMSHFHLSASGLGILGASFLIPYCIMQLPAGLIVQHYGARRILSFSAFLSALGLYLFACSTHLSVAIAGRALLGLSASCSFVSALYLISQWFLPKYFAILAGTLQFLVCIGSVIGLAPIAHALQHQPWQSLIIKMAILAFLLGILFIWVIRDKISIISLQPIQLQTTVRYICQHPYILRIFCIGFLSWIPITGIGALWGVPYLSTSLHMATSSASYFISYLWLGVGTGSILSGWISELIKRRKRVTIINFSVGLISGLMIIDAPHLHHIFLLIALYGIGFSGANQSLSFAYLKDQVPNALFSALSGINNMAAILGGIFAQLAIGYSLTWQNSILVRHPVYTTLQFQYALAVIPLASLIGLILCSSAIRESHPDIKAI